MDYRNFINGAIPSPPDDRDYTIDKFNVVSASLLPAEYTIPCVPDVQNQGQFGQCVAYALAGIKQSQEWKERGIKKRYSPAFIYANREITDWQGEGMFPRQALKRLCKHGTCEFDDFPLMGTYPTCKTEFNQKINQLLPIALPQRVHAYARLKKAQEIKRCLYEFKTPVLVCVNVYDSFYNTKKNGIVLPPSGSNNGGHAMIIIGWKIINGKCYFIVQNSWDLTWADSGLCYIDFDTYKFTECWAVLDQNPQQEINKAIEILLTIGNKRMVVDNKPVEMDTAPFYKDSRTFVPLRFVSEALGYTVQWYNTNLFGDNGDMIVITNGGEKTLDELKELANKL